MHLLPFILAGTGIYLFLIIPLIVAVVGVNFVSKKLELEEVLIENTIKIISFHLMEGFILFTVFALFAGRPFTQFVSTVDNPYLTLIMLLAILATAGFFIFIHFNIFSLYIKRFYNASLLRRILLYTLTTSAVWLLISFYSDAISFVAPYILV